METALKTHPYVKDIAVHAVFTESEDEVKATIIRVEGSSLTEEEFCSWCADQVPYFAVPRYFEFRDELPRNPVGRVLKHELRDQGCTPDTWDREAAGFKLVKR
jgi:crotonobetaine/carnitine-CoA ligase